MHLIEEAVTDYWGPRCPDFDSGCGCCEAWKQYNKMLDERTAIVAHIRAWAAVMPDSPLYAMSSQIERGEHYG